MIFKTLSKKIKRFLVFFIFLFLIFNLYFFLNNNCKNFQIFKIISNYGPSYIQNCFNIEAAKTNIKKVTFLYILALKIKTKYFQTDNNSQKSIIYKNIEFEDSFKSINTFIKGIHNKNYKNKNNISSDNEYEYDNWLRSHGGNWNTKYDSNDFINLNNIKKLKLVWKYSSIEESSIKKKWKQNIELNPIYINNKIIFVTADWKIVALNAKNGNLIWEHQLIYMPSRRGIVVENNIKKNRENLFIPIGNKVYKFNAKNGKIIKKFGNNGAVKAFTLVAPLIYKDTLVVVGKKEVFKFNKKTGKLINKINIHLKESNLVDVGGNVWGGVAMDKTKGILYLNTGNPGPTSIYGVYRPGRNKRSCSIVAINLSNLKIIWDFQETIHDLWDFDLAAPPILHNLKINDKIYEVIISLSKTGNTIILERNTGKPIFDINYKKAPKSDIDGEDTSPFQIDLKIPEKFSKIEFKISDIDKLPKIKQNEIKKKIKDYKYGWFETPSFDKNLITFGLHGGAEWTGGAIDPISQNVFIPVNNIPWKIRAVMKTSEINTNVPEKLKNNYELYIKKCSSCHGRERNGVIGIHMETEHKFIPSLVGLYIESNLEYKIGSIKEVNNKHNNIKINKQELIKLQKLFKWWDKKIIEKDELYIDKRMWSKFNTKDGLPGSNPPWGYIAKLNLPNGKILYKKPVGYLKKNGKNINIGTVSFGGLALNGAGILFFTGTQDNKSYAFNSETGEELWSYQMKAAGSTPPIIYNADGKQYVSFLSTGGLFHEYKEKDSTIYTFSISE